MILMKAFWKKVLKTTVKMQHLLCGVFENLHIAIQYDNNPEWTK